MMFLFPAVAPGRSFWDTFSLHVHTQNQTGCILLHSSTLKTLISFYKWLMQWLSPLKPDFQVTIWSLSTCSNEGSQNQINSACERDTEFTQCAWTSGDWVIIWGASQGVCLSRILSQALLQQELLLCSSLALTHFAVLLCKTVVINNAVFSPTPLDRQRNLYLFCCQIFFNSSWQHFQDHLSLAETAPCLWF